MESIADLSDQQAWRMINHLRQNHRLASTCTPAGILLEHPTAGSLSLALWDARADLHRLLGWLRAAGLDSSVDIQTK